MQHPQHHIFDFTPETLKPWCTDRGMKPFRAAQILEWVYQKGVIDPHAMSNLSKGERDLLAGEMTFVSSEIVAHKKATDGVQKLLMEWTEYGPHDATAPKPRGDIEPTLSSSLPILNASAVASRLSPVASPQTECVMIPALPDSPDPGRRTACISSQVGCPVGCKFCASGIGGLEGNLSAGRIVEQVWRLGRLEEVRRISNVVFMGMGEPLSNFANVTAALRTITSLWALGISARKVTVSTVGLPKAIHKLADELDLPITLALSLHAPTDELRRELIPWAHYSTITELLEACQRWFDKTGREITLEYTLLRNVNDLPEHAVELARLAKTLRANVNLIRYNEVAGMPFNRPRTDDVHAFQEILRNRGVNTHIRASRGRDIAAACGQLRHELSGKSA